METECSSCGLPEEDCVCHIADKEFNSQEKQESEVGVATSGLRHLSSPDNTLLEQLADLEHSQWSHIVHYLNGFSDSSSLFEQLTKWTLQAHTLYQNLSEIDKEKDRVWARKVLELLNNPTQNFKETSSKQSLGEREVNNQQQVQSNEATSVSLAGKGDDSSLFNFKNTWRHNVRKKV